MKKQKSINKLTSIVALVALVVVVAIATAVLVNNALNIVQTANSKVELIDENSKKENIEYGKEPVLVGLVATVGDDSEKTEEEKQEEERIRQEQEEKAKEEEEKKKQEEEEKKKQEEEEKKKQEEAEKKKQEEEEKNRQSYSSYYLKVNYLANVITVYTKDANGNLNPCKAITCSTGTDTPRSGVYTTGNKWRWKLLFHDWWGQYATHITGDILFHSVPYYSANNDALAYGLYDQLGTAASMGCIRLTVGDAKWIYDNIPMGTPVEFYGSYTSGPLGKPSTMRISSNTRCRAWDPTDPAQGNPWNTYFAEEQKKAEEAKAEAERKAAEEAAAKKKAEEEAAAKKKAEEEAAKKKAEEEAAAKKKAEEDAKRKAEEEAAAKKKAEEEAKKKAEQEAAKKKAEEEAKNQKNNKKNNVLEK